MSKFALLSLGILIGGAAIYSLMSLYDFLDEGTFRTYRCDQLAREDDARRSAEKIIQQFLLDKPLTELEAITNAAGLQMQRFDKLDHIAIVVGHGPGTAALNLEATMDGNISVLSIPGSISCETLEFDGR